MHLEPDGASFVGGGLWHPDGAALHRLRASIDERPGRWRRVLNGVGFRERFLGLGEGSAGSAGSAGGGGGGGKKKGKGKGRKKSGGGGEEGGGDGGEEQALKAFAEKNKAGALKTRPKGFNPEHRDMQLLKLKNFTVGTKVDEGLFTEAGCQAEIGQIVGDMAGFVSLPCFLRPMTGGWLFAGLDYADLTRSRTLIGLSCRTRGMTMMTRTRLKRTSDEGQ